VLVREALSYAIDRDLLVSSIMGGYGTPSNQHFMEGTWPNNPNLPPATYDPEKAKQLLADAGYPDGVDIKLIGSSSEGEEKLMALALQSMLAKSNINIELEFLAAASLSATNRGGWDGLLIFGAGVAPKMVTMTISTTLKGGNRIFYVDLLDSEKINSLINEALASPTMEIYQQRVWDLWEVVYAEEYQMVPIFIGDGILVKYPYVKEHHLYQTPQHKSVGFEATWLDK
jgi:ABC-type transport system substrate-binding protein